ncbi:hypothetical protein [Thermosediminibacter litoriperuensis]|uniref:Iron-only hydrogenase system regulator n=1 Tax=Thermosediminibacter litoriperuensis TaxID=291989 RepID=A0A5S5AWY8_9FIRM|nr:hypothetical protein [Thermosediminibacter litoriperuensis]TYP57871.1 hypothetical protein LZ11_00530 [Thermosediminibacter litoriperuensis]
MNCKTIMAILQDNRTQSAPKVQEILTKYGCNIRVRLGLHDVDEKNCSNEGLIILQLCGSDEDIQKLENELNSLERVKAKRIILSFNDEIDELIQSIEP